MKILVGHRGSVDFDEPLKLNEQKKQKFIEFIKTLFDPSVVEVTPSRTPRSKRLGEKNFGVSWNRKEQALLLGTDNNETLTEKLGRSWMSVVIQRGTLLPDFDAWCARNGYIRRGDYSDLIEKYLNEREFHKKKWRKRSQLLECQQCGILHLPEYDPKNCYSCGGRLQRIFVPPEEKLLRYKNQSRAQANPEFWEEFFKKYPPET
jgi:hypothetical protein